MSVQEVRKKLPRELQLHPERKKGCLRPDGEQGKGDADSRTSPAARRPKIAAIFGEKCRLCWTSTKELMADGQYWCPTCNKRFKPL
jgi:hypothetical protein